MTPQPSKGKTTMNNTHVIIAAALGAALGYYMGRKR